MIAIEGKTADMMAMSRSFLVSIIITTKNLVNKIYKAYIKLKEVKTIKLIYNSAL